MSLLLASCFRALELTNVFHRQFVLVVNRHPEIIPQLLRFRATLNAHLTFLLFDNDFVWYIFTIELSVSQVARSAAVIVHIVVSQSHRCHLEVTVHFRQITKHCHEVKNDSL